MLWSGYHGDAELRPTRGSSQNRMEMGKMNVKGKLCLSLKFRDDFFQFSILKFKNGSTGLITFNGSVCIYEIYSSRCHRRRRVVCSKQRWWRRGWLCHLWCCSFFRASSCWRPRRPTSLRLTIASLHPSLPSWLSRLSAAHLPTMTSRFVNSFEFHVSLRYIDGLPIFKTYSYLQI